MERERDFEHCSGEFKLLWGGVSCTKGRIRQKVQSEDVFFQIRQHSVVALTLCTQLYDSIMHAEASVDSSLLHLSFHCLIPGRW